MDQEEYKFPDEIETPVQEEKKPEVKAEKFEIEVEDDTPEKDRNRKPLNKPVNEVTDEELEQYSKGAKERIKRFSRGYHDERRAKETAIREREAAEQFARQVYEENQKLQKQLSTGSRAFIEQAKTIAETRLQAAEEKFRKAYESADTEGIVAAQKEIAKATVDIEQAERLRPVEEPEEKDIPKASAPAAPQQAAPVHERTQKWVSENADWFGKDEKMTKAAMSLDKRLKEKYGEDYLGTAHYFQVIDLSMRKNFPGYFGSSEEVEEPPKKSSKPAEEEAETPRRAKTAAVVAPASRSTPPNRVRLKASEVALAKRLGVPLELYAKHKVSQSRSGE